MEPKDNIVEIPFHGEDVEGMERVRKLLLPCPNCGNFDFHIAVRSDIPGDIGELICSSCRVPTDPNTIAIPVFNKLMAKAKFQNVRIHQAKKFWRMGFMFACAGIIYLAFFV